jgi:hypothetical protein
MAEPNCQVRDNRPNWDSTRLLLSCNPDALPQRDARLWPTLYRGPVGRLCHLKVVHASDMLNDAVARVVPDVHAEGEVRLAFHGQARLDSPWPVGIYTPSCRVPRGVNPMKSVRKRPAATKLRSWRVSILRAGAHHLGTIEAPDQRAAAAFAVKTFGLSEEQRRRLVVQERD